MTYVFVPAAVKLGPRKGPVKAFLVHMAEGGGTVGFLSRPNLRSVSVHYVIEYTGRIVQMVKEADASGSVNPNDIRKSDDPDGFYGVTAAKAVMGDWWKDPNSAVISVEIEGFARDGPNVKQQLALITLVKDVRSRHPGIGLLGHRDFADYKACPGKHIPWPLLGGHGPLESDAAGEPDMPGPNLTDVFLEPGWVTVKAIPGVQAIQSDDLTIRDTLPPGTRKPTIGKARVIGDPFGPDTPTESRHIVRLIGGKDEAGVEQSLAVVLAAQTEFEPTPVAVPNCDVAVNTALDRLTAPLSALVTAVQEARP